MKRPKRSNGPPAEIVGRVRRAFLILTPEELTEPLNELAKHNICGASLIEDAANGIQSVVSAATLPFQLILNSVHERKFDRLLAAERIRALKIPTAYGEKSSPLTEQEKVETAHKARLAMQMMLESEEGSDDIRDATVYALDHSLRSPNVSAAAAELLVQALVSTWAVFENFSSSFIIAWVNDDPRRAKQLLASSDLRIFFGKGIIDLDVIDHHAFNLTHSMGSVIFRGKRLDNLGIIRGAMDALFADADIRASLGNDLWMLNQRRHLFVHRRGIVDHEYRSRTGDEAPLGSHLSISSGDVEHYLTAVQTAVTAIATAAKKLGGASSN